MPSSPHHKLVLRGVACPLNFVKTKIQLEKMQPGEALEVVVDEGEPARNVPHSARMEGHEIIEQRRNCDGSCSILILKKH